MKQRIEDRITKYKNKIETVNNMMIDTLNRVNVLFLSREGLFIQFDNYIKEKHIVSKVDKLVIKQIEKKLEWLRYYPNNNNPIKNYLLKIGDIKDKEEIIELDFEVSEDGFDKDMVDYIEEIENLNNIILNYIKEVNYISYERDRYVKECREYIKKNDIENEKKIELLGELSELDRKVDLGNPTKSYSI